MRTTTSMPPKPDKVTNLFVATLGGASGLRGRGDLVTEGFHSADYCPVGLLRAARQTRPSTWVAALRLR